MSQTSDRNSKSSNPYDNYVYGLSGLAKLIGCSKSTALKIKDSGKIPFAKIGMKFIFDKEKVMTALASQWKGVE